MPSLFVNNLTVIDFAFFDAERGIVGESLILDVELFGELNDEGMLFDFSFVKKRIKSCVDSLVDHKFLVASQLPGLTIQESPQQLSLSMKTANGDSFEHISPHQAVYFVEGEQVNAQAIAQSIKNEIMKILPDNVDNLDLSLRSEVIEGAFYHYSHGLKKHFGDCQRIAHGHRSKIEVWEDQDFSVECSEFIAHEWRDIYLATNEDIKTETSINGKGYWVFEYHANQGLFQLTIAKNRCYLIETDTTVELIADYLAKWLKQRNPQSIYKVKAYEGVDKGAIVET